MRRRVLSAVLIGLAAVSASAVGRDPDPVLGTWVLDLARSSFSPGPPLRSQTRVYTETPDGIAFTLTGTSATGRPMRVEYTAPYDGRDHPLHGSPSSDSVALTAVDRFTVDAVEKKAGRAVFHVTRVISADGNRMTVTSDGTSATGTAIHNVLVFERKR